MLNIYREAQLMVCNHKVTLLCLLRPFKIALVVLVLPGTSAELMIFLVILQYTKSFFLSL